MENRILFHLWSKEIYIFTCGYASGIKFSSYQFCLSISYLRTKESGPPCKYVYGILCVSSLGLSALSYVKYIYIYIYCYQSIVFSYVCLRNRHTSFYLSTTVMSTYRTYDIYIYNVHFICFLLNTILCNMNRLSYLVNKCVTLSIWCVNYTIQRVFLH